MWSPLKPTSFNEGDIIDIHVGQLWSLVLGTEPRDFYSLNWCESTEGHQYDSNALEEGAGIQNDDVNRRTHESPY